MCVFVGVLYVCAKHISHQKNIKSNVCMSLLWYSEHTLIMRFKHLITLLRQGFWNWRDGAAVWLCHLEQLKAKHSWHPEMCICAPIILFIYSSSPLEAECVSEINLAYVWGERGGRGRKNWGRKVEHHVQEFLLILAGEDEPAQLLHLHSDLHLKTNAQSRWQITPCCRLC